MNRIIWDELKFFLTRLKSLSVSESMSINDESFCVSTGTYSENWIYCPNPERVNDAANFFRERDIAFMWPVYDSESLRHTDLIYAGDLTAMSLESNSVHESESNPDVKILRVKSHDDAVLWAKTAWHSFGGEYDDVPDNYYTFVDSLKDDGASSMYLATYHGKPSGTFLTTIMGGVYYFGVVPEMRRKGIAREMMNEICRNNKRVLLQSTPSGYAFYKSFGLTELFKIPVYSNESDIF